MPLVSAAGYPYNPVPEVGPSQTPGNDYQRISGAGPETFGAGVGQATERLGQQFERTGNVLAENAIQQQRLINQVAADNSTNYVMEETTKILHGDPNKPGDVGYYGLKGSAAVNARQDVVKRLDDVIQGARSKLVNDHQILTFNSETRRMRNYWMDSVGRHYDQQLNTFATQTADAQGQLATQGMASAAANGDRAGFDLFTENWMKARIQEVRHMGLGEDAVNAALGEVRGKATKIWADSLGQKDPLGALKFVEDNKDALLPGEYPQLIREFKAKAAAQQTQIDVFGNARSLGPIARQGGVGPHAAEAVDTFKKAGWTDAAIQGALSNGQAEGGFHSTWDNVGDGGDSRGHWQFNKKGEMPAYLAFSGGKQDTATQAAFVIKRMEEIHPGFGKITDPKLAADIMEREFERPANVTGNRYAGPINLPSSQKPQEGKTSFEEWMALQHPEVSLTPEIRNVAAGPADRLIRPLPPREEGQLPDEQVGVKIGGVTLQEKLQQLAKDIPLDDPQRYVNAVNGARKAWNQAYSDQQHQYRLHQEQVKAQDEATKSQYIGRMQTGSTNYPTTNEVMADVGAGKLTAEAGQNLIGFIERQTRPDPASALSAKNKRMLFDRIHRPDDDPEKIWSEQALDDAYKKEDLTWADHTAIVQNFRESYSSTDKDLAKHKAELLTRVKPKIIPSAAFGKMEEQFIDAPGEERFALYERMVEDKIKEYRKANKNPDDLFNPTKPDYVGSKEILESPQYAPSLKQKLSDVKPKNSQVRTAPSVTLETAKDLPDLQALYAANPADRDKIIAEGVRRGLIRPNAPTPEVPIR
jgi:hypothetical protein